MTETAEPRTPAQDTIAMTAATMGHDIVAAMLGELRTMPGHWSTLSAELQQKMIERMKEKTSGMVKTAIAFMLTSEFKAVPARLDYMSRSKELGAKLSIDTKAMYRHALFDAIGSHVLVVITDPEQWLGRMDEIKARGNQLDLFALDADYDPARDQPGYRRDQDPLAPAGKSWEDLKKSLGVTDPVTPQPAVTDAPAVPPGESLSPDQEHEAMLRELQERLADVGAEVSMGTLQSRSDADILAASLWLNWYTSNDVDVPFLDRPTWIPEPPHNAEGKASK